MLAKFLGGYVIAVPIGKLIAKMERVVELSKATDL